MRGRETRAQQAGEDPDGCARSPTVLLKLTDRLGDLRTTDGTCAQQENEIGISAVAASIAECRILQGPASRSEHPDRTVHLRQCPELR